MIIQCSSCKTKFNLPDKAYKKGGKAKCSVCGNVFTMGGEPEPELDMEQEIDTDGELTDSSQEKGDSLSSDVDAAAAPRQAQGKDSFSLDDADSGGLGFDLDVDSRKGKGKSKGGKASGKPSGKSKKKLFIVLALLLLIVAGGAGYWFYFMKQGAHPSGDEAAKEVVPTERIKNIALQDVRQYYVNNDVVGKVFVIQGAVVNNFPMPKELIRVEATLFDANNVAVMSKQLHCGNTLSLTHLKQLDEQSLESELNNKVGILTNNTNVPPGGSVPFMIAFYNPPATVTEFGVKVIEAKDPPQ